jgi:hypothetical protein
VETRREDIIYIEPAFLFYLRWRQQRELTSLTDAGERWTFAKQLLRELQVITIDHIVAGDKFTIVGGGNVTQVLEEKRKPAPNSDPQTDQGTSHSRETNEP